MKIIWIWTQEKSCLDLCSPGLTGDDDAIVVSDQRMEGLMGPVVKTLQLTDTLWMAALLCSPKVVVTDRSMKPGGSVSFGRREWNLQKSGQKQKRHFISKTRDKTWLSVSTAVVMEQTQSGKGMENITSIPTGTLKTEGFLWWDFHSLICTEVLLWVLSFMYVHRPTVYTHAHMFRPLRSRRVVFVELSGPNPLLPPEMTTRFHKCNPCHWLCQSVE